MYFPHSASKNRTHRGSFRRARLHPRPGKKPGPNCSVCSLHCPTTVLIEESLSLFGTSTPLQYKPTKLRRFQSLTGKQHDHMADRKAQVCCFIREFGQKVKLYSLSGLENNYPETKMIKATCLYSLCNSFSNHCYLASKTLVNKAKKKNKVEIFISKSEIKHQGN